MWNIRLFLIWKFVSLKPFMINGKLLGSSNARLVDLSNWFTRIDFAFNFWKCFSLQLPKHADWRRCSIWIQIWYLTFFHFLRFYLILYNIDKRHVKLACLLDLWFIWNNYEVILFYHFVKGFALFLKFFRTYWIFDLSSWNSEERTLFIFKLWHLNDAFFFSWAKSIFKLIDVFLTFRIVEKCFEHLFFACLII